MRILFTAQSASLRMFDSLRAVLAQKSKVERSGFIISDSQFYCISWLREKPDFEKQGHCLLKEWEITAQRTGRPDLKLLRNYEEMLGAPAGLFGAVVADRRLFMGKNCSISQDYRRRFSDDELLCILQAAIQAVGRMFDDLKPDLVLTCACVTIFDYLVYLFAKALKIKFLNLRPTRVGDRITYGSLLNDPTPEFMHAYTRNLCNGSRFDETARTYIEKVRHLHGKYEGAAIPSVKPAKRKKLHPRYLFPSAMRFWQNYQHYNTPIVRNDNHVPNPMRSLMFAALINPWRAWYSHKKLSKHYILSGEMNNRRYAFFPLHTEPEVSLLVYSRPYINQIEVIRAIIMSLPADMILVIKEHPWMVGKRPFSVYREMLNIPRVRFASPKMEARELAQKAALVIVLTSSVGLESAILKRPVVTIGDCPYNALPETMVSQCSDLRQLPQTIRKLLESHDHDEKSLEAYLATVFELSEGINLFSVLLGRDGIHTERTAGFGHEIERLAQYTLAFLSRAGEVEITPVKLSANW